MNNFCINCNKVTKNFLNLDKEDLIHYSCSDCGQPTVVTPDFLKINNLRILGKRLKEFNLFSLENLELLKFKYNLSSFELSELLDWRVRKIEKFKDKYLNEVESKTKLLQALLDNTAFYLNFLEENKTEVEKEVVNKSKKAIIKCQNPFYISNLDNLVGYLLEKDCSLSLGKIQKLLFLFQYHIENLNFEEEAFFSVVNFNIYYRKLLIKHLNSFLKYDSLSDYLKDKIDSQYELYKKYSDKDLGLQIFEIVNKSESCIL